MYQIFFQPSSLNLPAFLLYATVSVLADQDRYGVQGWINEVFQCSFAGSTHEQSLVGLWLDFACNSINVLDSMFEGRLATGVVANQGSVVRIEGNTMENMGGVSLSP